MTRGAEQATDEDLVAAVLAGDRERFGDLIERYQGRLVNYLFRLLRNADDAHDLAQEVLVLLHEKYSHVTRLEELVPLSFQILRFKLVSHPETRELPIYALMVAKGGSKLEETKSNGLKISGSYGKLVAEGVTTDGLARELAKAVGRVVVDKTGISGRFDVTLRWTPDQGPAMLNGEPIPDPPPSIFTAIQEQLGLKLDSQKGPVQVLVVEHVETPTAN